MNQRTRQQALKALEGMEQIVRADMLVHGEYVTDIEDEKKHAEGAICDGRKFCAIGALWMGGGVKLLKNPGYSPGAWTAGDGFALPGVSPTFRDEFLSKRHGLRAAYNALNEVARAWLLRHKRYDDLGYMAEEVKDLDIEDVFEGDYHDRRQIGRGDMLRFINSARERILAA